MEIEAIAQKIAKDYISSNTDMNSSIAKYASENNLSIEHTKRLVEESNKQCFLSKFAATGEQVFDVADFKEVSKLVKSNEGHTKTASYSIEPIDYKLAPSDEKVAANTRDLYDAMDVCRDRIGASMNKLAELRVKIVHQNPQFMNEPIEKIAEHESGSVLRPHIKNIEAQNKIIDHLTKQANIMSSAAGMMLTGAANTVGPVVRTAVANPMKTFIGVGVVQSGMAQGQKALAHSEKVVSNMPTLKIAEEGKEALANEFTSALSAAAPYIFATGAIGLTVAAARKMGGVAGRMMQERQLNEAFDVMAKKDPEIRQIPNARSYFDVIARHSPSIAVDPVVAPGIIKQMDQFGGVDLNTVGKLREIETRGPMSPSSLDIANGALSSARSIQDMAGGRLHDMKMESDILSNRAKTSESLASAKLKAYDLKEKLNPSARPITQPISASR